MTADSANAYAGLTEEELLLLAEQADALPPEDHELLWIEIRRRGLEGMAVTAYDEAATRREAPPVPLEKLVTIARFNDAGLADLAKSKLEAESIECFLDYRHTLPMNPFYPSFVGLIDVQVKEGDAGKALAALEQAGAPAEGG